MENEWIRCPICGNKTRDRLRKDTVLLAPGRNSHFGCNRNRQFELR